MLIIILYSQISYYHGTMAIIRWNHSITLIRWNHTLQKSIRCNHTLESYVTKNISRINKYNDMLRYNHTLELYVTIIRYTFLT